MAWQNEATLTRSRNHRVWIRNWREVGRQSRHPYLVWTFSPLTALDVVVLPFIAVDGCNWWSSGISAEPQFSIFWQRNNGQLTFTIAHLLDAIRFNVCTLHYKIITQRFKSKSKTLQASRPRLWRYHMVSTRFIYVTCFIIINQVVLCRSSSQLLLYQPATRINLNFQSKAFRITAPPPPPIYFPQHTREQ